MQTSTIICGVLNAFIAAVVGFGGVYYGVQSQNQLQRQEALLNYTTTLWRYRVETIQATSTAMSESKRIAVFRNVLDGKGEKLLPKILFCSSVSDATAAGQCETLDPTDAKTADLIKDVFALHGRFAAAQAAAKNYFCDRTHAALKSLPAGAWWWNASEDAQAELLGAMESEKNCGLEPILNAR